MSPGKAHGESGFVGLLSEEGALAAVCMTNRTKQTLAHQVALPSAVQRPQSLFLC